MSAKHALLLDAVADRVTPGAQYAAIHREHFELASVGRYTYAPDSPAVTDDTLFDTASLTKVLVGTAVAMLLWQQGRLDLEAPVCELLPEFGADDPRKLRVTARMLLAHSSGLPAHRRLWESADSRDALIGEVLRSPLEAEPGTRAVYSDLGFIILTRLLEHLTGERLDHFADQQIFRPLGMLNTFYRPNDPLRCAPTDSGNDFRHRLIQGEVHDENCAVMNGVSAHAGVFSTARDLARFAQCFLRGGTPLYRGDTVVNFTRRQPAPPGTTRTLGWDTPSASSSSGRYFSPRSFGHLGFTGTSLWIDPTADLAIVLLTNRVWPDRGNLAGMQRLRPAFHDAAREELGLT